MPIYAYRCESCGHAKDILQRLSDPVLSICPACGVEAFKKQLTSAGFQLKGSGWYVTDFKDGTKAPKAPAETAAKADAAKSESGKTQAGETKSAPAPAPTAAPTSAPAAAPAVAAPSPGPAGNAS